MANRKTTTSNAVKDRWKAAHYDTIRVYLDKADAEIYKAKCKSSGVTLSDIPKQAILDFIEKTE